MSERRIAELIMPYSAIGKRALPADIFVIGVLPQESRDIAGGHARFLIEGEALDAYHGGWEALRAFTSDQLEKHLQEIAA